MEAEVVVRLIDEGFDSEPRERPRDYIGASIIGHPCEACLAFSLRGFANNPIPPKLKRIFRDGHRIEDQVVRDLIEKADLRVWPVDPDTGEQWTWTEWGGHIALHADGKVQLGSQLALLEIKSMNATSFSQVRLKGVRISDPKYYDQMTMMMGMSGIPRTLFICYCKDNSEYHAEIVAFDPIEASWLEARVERVFRNEAMKVARTQEDWRCRTCSKSGVCWGAEIPHEPECKFCAHAIPTPDGLWHCQLHDQPATDPCSSYEVYQPKERKP